MSDTRGLLAVPVEGGFLALSRTEVEYVNNHVARERNEAVRNEAALAARLAEVEKKLQTAEGEAYYWRSLCSEDDRVEQLQRRLAEVEAENAELIEKLKAGLSRDDRTSLSSLFGYDLGVEEGRAEGQAERDRLAQELEDALGHLRDVTGSAGYVDRANAMGEALSFLARVEEGGEGS